MFFGNKIIDYGFNDIDRSNSIIDISIYSKTCVFLFSIVYCYDNKSIKRKSNRNQQNDLYNYKKEKKVRKN